MPMATDKKPLMFVPTADSYINELRFQFKEGAKTGYYNWELIKEVKAVSGLERIFNKLNQLKIKA